MVSDGCGDCARRLPQKTKTKRQTKRAIMILNPPWKHAEHALAALEAAGACFGWPGTGLRPSRVERAAKSFLQDLSLLVWGRGIAPLRQGNHASSCPSRRRTFPATSTLRAL